MSLTQLCSYLEVSTDILISLRGLNQRFNASAVQFLKQVLINLLSRRIHFTKNNSSIYHNILASKWISSHYQGSDGNSYTLEVKILL